MLSIYTKHCVYAIGLVKETFDRPPIVHRSRWCSVLIDIGYNRWITADVGGGTVDEWKDVDRRIDQTLPPA